MRGWFSFSPGQSICRPASYAITISGTVHPSGFINDACPQITVDPQTFEVLVDGQPATCEPARVLPLAQRYMLR